MDINEAIQHWGLGVRIDTAVAHNPWFARMEFEANQLCGQLGDIGEPTDFAFVSHSSIQACALYPSRSVIVTAGMLDFLCRLTARIVHAGMFPSIGTTQIRPRWNPDDGRTAALPRHLVLAEDEDSNFMSPPWQNDLPRSGLYFYVLLTLFRFVVLHEMGHHFHRHGERSATSRAHMDIDAIEPHPQESPAAVDSQARELMADKFAADALVKLQEHELERLLRTELTRPFAEKFLDTQQKRVAFLLNVIYVYFSAMEAAPDLDPELAVTKTHPPSAFRLVTVAANLWQSTTLSLGDEAAKHTILAAATAGDALFVIALNRKPDPHWLSRMDQPAFSEHYVKLHAAVARWHRDRI